MPLLWPPSSLVMMACVKDKHYRNDWQVRIFKTPWHAVYSFKQSVRTWDMKMPACVLKFHTLSVQSDPPLTRAAPAMARQLIPPWMTGDMVQRVQPLIKLATKKVGTVRGIMQRMLQEGGQEAWLKKKVSCNFWCMKEMQIGVHAPCGQ